jgi:hypothetical protein
LKQKRTKKKKTVSPNLFQGKEGLNENELNKKGQATCWKSRQPITDKQKTAVRLGVVRASCRCVQFCTLKLPVCLPEQNADKKKKKKKS